MNMTPCTPQEFHAAYLAIGKGRGYVRIHRLRETLKWMAEDFDDTLRLLMRNHIVVIHGGDPTSLTPEEVKDSYEDANGMLYVTLSWIGDQPARHAA